MYVFININVYICTVRAARGLAAAALPPAFRGGSDPPRLSPSPSPSFLCALALSLSHFLSLSASHPTPFLPHPAPHNPHTPGAGERGGGVGVQWCGVSPPLDDFRFTLAERRIRMCQPRNGPQARPDFISLNVIIKGFCKNQFPHKSVNLFSMITNTKNELMDLCGN